MAAVVYQNLVFPHSVGGPGPVDVVALTVTASGSSTDSNECLTQTDIVAYNAASASDKLRHERFSDVVSFVTQYAKPISIDAVTNNVITMRFERKGIFENSALGKPGWFSYGHRPNMFDLCATLVAAEGSAPHYLSTITITINGSAQSGT